MTGVAAAAPAPREQGWRLVVVATLLLLFVPMTPLVRILVPVEHTLVLVAPVLAACAVAGWWAGGRSMLAVVWIALAAWVLWAFTNGAGTFELLTGGWALLLAVAFGVLALAQRADVARPFLPRALNAIALTLLLAGGAALAAPDGAAGVRRVVEAEATQRASESLDGWRQMTGTTEWQDFAKGNPDAATLAAEVEKQLQATPPLATMLFPAMLALESLAALGLAWAVYHRVGRARLGPPLALLRDFRFNDQLIWGLIVGLVMVVVPAFAPFRGLGANLLVFFGALYAIRGLGVVIWFLAPGRLVMALLIGFAVLFWHVLGVLALGVGLGDTWLDWRHRVRTKTQ